MYNTAIFDLDGTLLNTLGDLATAGNHCLSTLGYPPHPVGAYRLMVGNGIPTLVRRMLPEGCRGEGIHAVALSLFRKYYTACMWDTTAPYPGIPELLDELGRAGVKLAVLSNKEDDFVREILLRFFPGRFDAAMGHRENWPPKPDPSSLLALVQEMGADPAATLYLGDSDVDVLTAHAASLPCCGVLWGFRSEEELAATGADFLAESPEKVASIIMQ